MGPNEGSISHALYGLHYCGQAERPTREEREAVSRAAGKTRRLAKVRSKFSDIRRRQTFIEHVYTVTCQYRRVGDPDEK